MSQSDQPGGASAGAPESHLLNVQPTEMTGWVGWIAFAGVMMVLLGTFHAIQGLVALFQDEYFLVAKSGLTVHVDYTAWGWVHLILGIIIAGAGFALFTGKTWARALGVVIVMISAVVNIGFLAAYPIWSVLMIAVDILVIWALIVHGAELEQ
ncbi:MAG TPA: hypothetical protein VMT27_03500 [Actinomycetes bacterium]|nr:hypothetical protein [Actinomycetes bacterium]